MMVLRSRRRVSLFAVVLAAATGANGRHSSNPGSITTRTTTSPAPRPFLVVPGKTTTSARHHHDSPRPHGGGGAGGVGFSIHHRRAKKNAPAVPLRGGGDVDAGVDTSTVASSSASSSSSKKLANFRQRLVPAVALLVGLYWIVHNFQAKGLTVLLLLLTPGLYHEAVSVVLQEPSSYSALETAFKWWWFVACSCATTVPRVLQMFAGSDDSTTANKVQDWHNLPHVAHLVSYTMIVTGFMAWIYCLNAVPEAAAGHFQSAWNEVAVYTMGLVFTVIPVAFWMAVLALEPHGMGWALYTALLVILNDTMAYLFGVTLGKSALLPVISPKKTREGWIGALVSTMLLSRPLWKLLMSSDGYNKHALVVALFCCVVAPTGGFLASSLKRAGGKKDFGDLIAGHGGLVDRLDCQLLAAPFLYLYLKAAQV